MRAYSHEDAPDVAFVTEGLDPEGDAARARLEAEVERVSAEVDRANAADPDAEYRKHLALLVSMGSTPEEAAAILTRRRADAIADLAAGTTPLSADEAYDALVGRAQARVDAASPHDGHAHEWTSVPAGPDEVQTSRCSRCNARRLDEVPWVERATPPVVCICGSTRFRAEMAEANRRLTLAGSIVVAPGVFGHDGDPMTDEDKLRLDALHLRKIDLANSVYVVNPGGYIGESTTREIAYAHRTGKPVRFLTEDIR